MDLARPGNDLTRARWISWISGTRTNLLQIQSRMSLAIRLILYWKETHLQRSSYLNYFQAGRNQWAAFTRRNSIFWKSQSMHLGERSSRTVQKFAYSFPLLSFLIDTVLFGSLLPCGVSPIDYFVTVRTDSSLCCAESSTEFTILWFPSASPSVRALQKPGYATVPLNRQLRAEGEVSACWVECTHAKDRVSVFTL